MNLVKSRNRLLDKFIAGYKPSGLLEEYRPTEIRRAGEEL